MKNLDVKALMRQISRWYDVDVVYEGQLPERHFGGIIDQNIYLSNIIKVLEAGASAAAWKERNCSSPPNSLLCCGQ